LIKAKKSLGQNFLQDESIIERIIESVRPQKVDLIFEIGPGTGALTRRLIGECGLLVCVELDPRLIASLQSAFKSDQFLLIQADALSVDWHNLHELALAKYRTAEAPTADAPRLRLVANLPYYISTPIVERLLTSGLPLFDLTLMLQEEVVDRIVSPPGGREYGYLSVLVQYYCEAEKLFVVPPSAFSPVPKVRSAILRLTPRSRAIIDIENPGNFFALVRKAFAQRRKTILNNLKAAASISKYARDPQSALQICGLEASRRAETFSLHDFAALYHSLYDE
jgi:16S rRNA (adenine1518-N6/adenine1519-N6)-dimethyltransferase